MDSDNTHFPPQHFQPMHQPFELIYPASCPFVAIDPAHPDLFHQHLEPMHEAYQANSHQNFQAQAQAQAHQVIKLKMIMIIMVIKLIMAIELIKTSYNTVLNLEAQGLSVFAGQFGKRILTEDKKIHYWNLLPEINKAIAIKCLGRGVRLSAVETYLGHKQPFQIPSCWHGFTQTPEKQVIYSKCDSADDGIDNSAIPMCEKAWSFVKDQTKSSNQKHEKWSCRTCVEILKGWGYEVTLWPNACSQIEWITSQKGSNALTNSQE
ncbi:hypothetical protein DFH28DRAFT_932866 [Melampsora americana]|nr:hypothetical protein DFH28DRAFT_932866 [Melampsora americana]